jgi:hypothetical protein
MTVASYAYASPGAPRRGMPWVAVGAAAAALLLLYSLRGSVCGSASSSGGGGSSPAAAAPKGMAEAELHAKGLWRSPRLGVDAFIVRHVKSSDAWEVLLVQARTARRVAGPRARALANCGRAQPAKARRRASPPGIPLPGTAAQEGPLQGRLAAARGLC